MGQFVRKRFAGAMTELSITRQVVRAIHAGIAGVLFILAVLIVASDYEMRDALLQENWGALKPLGYLVALATPLVGIALLVPRAGAALLAFFALLDMPMVKLFWNSEKGFLLAPVLVASMLCIGVEIIRQAVAGKRLAR
jgi:hypothetical protein